MNSEQKRAALAVVLSGIVLFSWQYFYGNKTAVESTKKTSLSTDPYKAGVGQSGTSNLTADQGDKLASAQNTENIDNNLPKTIEFKDTKIELVAGATLVNFNSSNSYKTFSELYKSNSFRLFAFDGKNEIPLMVGDGSSASEVRLYNSNAKIEGKLSVDQDEKVKINLTSDIPYRYLIKMKLDKSEDKNIEKRFVAYSNEVHFYSLSSKQEEAKVLWLGMDYNYHLFALVFSEKIAGKIDVTEDGNFTFLSSNELKNFSSEMVFSRKDYDRLTALGSGLELSVDFGLLGIIAVPILRGLQFLYKYIPNYGVGIILLTLLMRIITFPLQYKSFVSMKRMQKIQPELNKLKEKYKEDPQKMQKETMDLFKKAGANPLGGCLPMLAQMPIFFAFYKVLGASVELVGAPFYFWIHDLSLKDPFFILPILMTGLMFLQQKLTPSGTSDPTQKKIMLLMPLIFGFIMKDLPSGLVLYICVSTVVGIIQQMLVFRAAD